MIGVQDTYRRRSARAGRRIDVRVVKDVAMGWIVYNTASGRADRYYKSERTAKQQATRRNRDPFRSRWEAGEWQAISYTAYEGVLMGLKAENLRYWDWLNSAGG